MEKTKKNILQYILLGIFIIAEILWLLNNIEGVYLFISPFIKDMFIFCLITVIHAIILICISIGGIIRIRKDCRCVLGSGLLMKLYATCICLSAQYIFMNIYERAAIFALIGIVFGCFAYVVSSREQISKRYIFLMFCLIAEIIWFACWLLGFMDFSSDRDNHMFAVSVIIHAVAFIAVSLVSMARLKKGSSAVLRTSLHIKMCVTCFWLCAVYLDMKIYEAVGTCAVVGIIFLLAALYSFYNANYAKNKVIKHVDKIKKIKRFTADKAKWSWNEAAEEYCRVVGKTLGALTDDEKTKIYDYAGTPTAYFLAWLIKHDFVSETFKSEPCDEDYINEIIEEKVSPVELFRDMDYVLSRDDISKNVLSFVDIYYDNHGCRIIYNYMYDYYETIRNDNKTYYFTEFSWDKYHTLEDKINREYNRFNDTSGEEEVEFGKCFYELFNTELDIVTDSGVSEEYVNRCVEHVNNVCEKFIDELCGRIINWVFDDSFIEIPDEVKQDKRKILKYVYPTDMYVYVPKNNDIGYVINCGCDFEDEHGISWVVRNDEIVFLSCNGDEDSPWSDNCEREYKKQKAVKRINPQSVDTVEKAKELVQNGDLQAVERIPEKGGEDNIIFVPEVIAERKQKQDIMVELMKIRHDADEYSCGAEYKNGSVVPCSLTVSAMKDGKNVFLRWIEIW